MVRTLPWRRREEWQEVQTANVRWCHHRDRRNRDCHLALERFEPRRPPPSRRSRSPRLVLFGELDVANDTLAQVIEEEIVEVLRRIGRSRVEVSHDDSIDTVGCVVQAEEGGSYQLAASVEGLRLGKALVLRRSQVHSVAPFEIGPTEVSPWGS